MQTVPSHIRSPEMQTGSTSKTKLCKASRHWKSFKVSVTTTLGFCTPFRLQSATWLWGLQNFFFPQIPCYYIVSHQEFLFLLMQVQYFSFSLSLSFSSHESCPLWLRNPKVVWIGPLFPDGFHFTCNLRSTQLIESFTIKRNKWNLQQKFTACSPEYFFFIVVDIHIFF